MTAVTFGDQRRARHRPRTGWSGRGGRNLQRSMRPLAVVVGAVSGEDGPQMSLAEDQDAVGELGSGGQDNSLGEAVCSRTSRWILTVSMPEPAKTASKAVAN